MRLAMSLVPDILKAQTEEHYAGIFQPGSLPFGGLAADALAPLALFAFTLLALAFALFFFVPVTG